MILYYTLYPLSITTTTFMMGEEVKVTFGSIVSNMMTMVGDPSFMDELKEIIPTTEERVVIEEEKKTDDEELQLLLSELEQRSQQRNTRREIIRARLLELKDKLKTGNRVIMREVAELIQENKTIREEEKIDLDIKQPLEERIHTCELLQMDIEMLCNPHLRVQFLNKMFSSIFKPAAATTVSEVKDVEVKEETNKVDE